MLAVGLVLVRGLVLVVGLVLAVFTETTTDLWKEAKRLEPKVCVQMVVNVMVPSENGRPI